MLGFRAHRREPLRPKDVRALLAAARTNPVHRLTVSVLLETGLRVSEFAALRPDDVDIEQQRLVVLHGKGDRRRVMYIRTALARDLVRYLGRTHAHTRRQIAMRVRTIAMRADIRRPCSPHVLRHTFAVNALQRGLSLAALQRALGHSQLATTAIYLNMSPEDALTEMAAKLSKKRRMAG